MIKHRVAAGECMASISYRYGFHWDTLWSHPDNAELRRARENPNVLMPGDVVVVPDRRLKKEERATGARHRFKLRGVPAKLSLRILEGGEPRAHEPFVASIDGVAITGTTGADGELSIFLPPDAREGTLVVGAGEDAVEYQLGLRRLAPITEILGVQQRLENLGFGVGGEAGAVGPATSAALSAFQRSRKLPETGAIDEATVARLAAEHGV